MRRLLALVAVLLAGCAGGSDLFERCYDARLTAYLIAVEVPRDVRTMDQQGRVDWARDRLEAATETTADGCST